MNANLQMFLNLARIYGGECSFGGTGKPIRAMLIIFRNYKWGALRTFPSAIYGKVKPTKAFALAISRMIEIKSSLVIVVQ